jgi:hypothetical protein
MEKYETVKNNTLEAVANPKVFVEYLKNASKHNRHAEFFHMYSPEEYATMTMLVLGNGIAGCAIKQNGELVSVFKNEELAREAGIDKVSGIIIPAAIQYGARKLDCYSGFLDSMYARFGFSPVAKLAFDTRFAPNSWNYEKYGKPDIVFMAYNNSSKQEIPENILTVVDYKAGYSAIDNFLYLV